MMDDLQKASMWKRISAFLFDAILLSVVAVLFAFILSGLLGYNTHAATVNNAYDQYGEMYQVDMRLSATAYEQLGEAEKARMTEAFDALNADEGARKALGMMLELSLMIVSFGLLLAFLLMEFLIPLLFKNGQTLGKKIFGIAVMHTSSVKLSAPMLFARTVLGKYAVETMVPVFIIMMLLFGAMGGVGLLVLLLLFILQAVVMIATHTNSCIHDLLAKTVTVDMGSQMIFDSREALIAYKEKRHAEKVAQQSY
ncbi:MAG: RDD family protein [Clostridia bacterium]|nr:RDD family protein [Clostridia bacterium]